ncbi:histidine kinase [Geobacillus subterraneus]|uniref:Histidine kinase n=2 Tax=Geobacillus TaxID=129337 RepID=A0ABM6AE48_9BACL|nr:MULTISPECIES: SpoIIE family protein phosphatase [Geobacillus]AMX84636.1 histidine kinase [Geobacillus subterraneus]KZS24838.1 histidine kinase [Geobacillus subterraneus]OXB85458.1 histidine kinase [Geobacillus uzenensis]
MINGFLEYLRHYKDFAWRELLDSLEKMNVLFAPRDDVYWLAAPDQRKILFISSSCEQLYGLPPAAFYHDTDVWIKLLYPDDRAKAEEKWAFPREVEANVQTYRIVNQRDGSVRWVLERTVPVLGEPEEGKLISGFVTDITEAKRNGDELRLAEQVYAAIEQAMLVTDGEFAVRFINPAFTKITGYSAEVIGQPLHTLYAGYYDSWFYEVIKTGIDEGGEWQGRVRWRQKNGSVSVRRTTVRAVYSQEGGISFYLFLFSGPFRESPYVEAMKDDLTLAREVQKRVLSKPLSANGIGIAGTYIPSQELGGDMYAWYPIDKQRYGIFLMDVMGHGAAASLICMSVRSLLNGIIRKGIVPKEVFRELNRHMRQLYHENGRMTYYFTAVYVLVDVEERVIEYASAGHPPGFLFQPDGTVAELDRGCAPIGLLPRLFIESGQLRYEPGATLVLYSDGAIEGEVGSVRKNIEAFRDALAPYVSLDERALLARLRRHFAQKGPLSDDFSAVVAKLG